MSLLHAREFSVAMEMFQIWAIQSGSHLTVCGSWALGNVASEAEELNFSI